MLLPQLPSFWLDRHHCDTYVDIVAPCTEVHALSSSDPKQPSITGYCTCDKNCSGLCGKVTSPQDPSSSKHVHTESQHVVASLPCHRVLLSAASPYFAALLSPAWNQGCSSASSSSSSIKRIPVVLSDADDVPAMIALLKCIYTGEINLVPADLAAVTAAPSCSSSSSSSPQHTQHSLTAATDAPHNCSCLKYLPDLQSNMHKLCWQELSVRVLRLADQFSVPGALQAAGGKLCCLFSYQLSWRAVLALLWLPAAVMQQQKLKELRQMAINRVTQDLKHLDPCLASATGRTILQHLPPDALATLLGSDQLALLSENTTLAAIDVWLAGPVASSLAAAPAPASAAAPNPASDVRSKHDMYDMSERSSGSSRLAAALQLLVRQVRLPLCSGAFLAAAVSQRPWLCLGLQGCHELGLMQQYYSSDSHGRYELAMQLLRAGQGCPWSVMMRKGLPATFSQAASTIYNCANHVDGSSSSSSSTNSVAGKGTGVASGVSNGMGMYTGLSWMRALLEWDATCVNSSSSSGSGCSSPKTSSGSAAGLQALQQQGAAAAAAAAAGEGSNIMLNRKVLGGYVWQLSLVAVPWLGQGHVSSGCVPQPTAAAAAAVSVFSSNIGLACADANAMQGRRLCLAMECRPAWANVLDEGHPGYDSTAASHDTAAATVQLDEKCGWPVFSAAAAAADAAGQQPLHCCVTCEALWTIAGAKTAEAVARHSPLMQQLLPGVSADEGYCCSCRTSSSRTTPAAAATVSNAVMCEPMQVCEQAAGTAEHPFNSSSSSWTGANALAADSCSVAEVPGICCSKQNSCSSSCSSCSARVEHLDVVVGVQLVAAASQAQLQQQVGPGATTSSRQCPAIGHVPCLLRWDAAAGAARALVPIDVAAIGSGSNVLGRCQPNINATAAGHAAVAGADVREGEAAQPGRGVSNTCVGNSSSEVGVLSGWQPELWSALAPSGALYWHASLRPLMD